MVTSASMFLVSGELWTVGKDTHLPMCVELMVVNAELRHLFKARCLAGASNGC